MKSYTIVTVSTQLNLINTINFINSLKDLPDFETYIFDFGAMKWIEPFSMLYLSHEILKYRKSKPNCKFEARNFESSGYAGYMGFFQAFGLNFGNSPNKMNGNEAHIPITMIDVSNFQSEANENFEYVGKSVERHSKKLAKVLAQKSNDNIIKILEYSFTEILRNVIEHSQSNSLNYCAQFWPSHKKAEIAILDTGIGIKESLKSNPYLEFHTHQDALNLCLMPGISRNIVNNKVYTDEWENSGYGLYMTHRLCRNGGEFFICSGNSGILLNKKGKNYISNIDFSGTALRLILEIEQIPQVSKLLSQYSKEGNEITKKLKEESGVTMSSIASKFLDLDFEL